MVDQLRLCQECGNYRHVSYFNVGWRGCLDCENRRRNLMADLGMVTPDQLFAENERKIWGYARKHGHKIDRLID